MTDATPVETSDSSKRTSKIKDPDSNEPTVQIIELDEMCYWNDIEYKTGDSISFNGKCYECSFGQWLELEQ